MGGIIIRAALPHLSEFKDRMHTFITLSSPHLGKFNKTRIYVQLKQNCGCWYLGITEIP